MRALKCPGSVEFSGRICQKQNPVLHEALSGTAMPASCATQGTVFFGCMLSV